MQFGGDELHAEYYLQPMKCNWMSLLFDMWQNANINIQTIFVYHFVCCCLGCYQLKDFKKIRQTQFFEEK